jgi:hypothetical protein
MSKKIKIVFFVLLGITLVGFSAYNYVMTGGARDLSQEETEFTVTSQKIITEFTQNIDVCNKKYLEKAIAIEGTITAVNGKEIILDNTIVCQCNDITSCQKDQKIMIKGRVVGYDDLLGELKLDQCFTIKK